MRGKVRIGDMTVGVCDHGESCCPHNCIGIHTSGSDITSVDDKGSVRFSDISIHNCPHCNVNYCISGSNIVTTDGLITHRCGDIVNENCGIGISVSCSDITTTD